MWVDRMGAKVAVTEQYSRSSHGSLGLVAQQVTTVDETGAPATQGMRTSPFGQLLADGPPTGLGGTGTDRVLYAQGTLVRDTTYLVNAATVGARDIFTVSRGGGGGDLGGGGLHAAGFAGFRHACWGGCAHLAAALLPCLRPTPHSILPLAHLSTDREPAQPLPSFVPPPHPHPRAPGGPGSGHRHQGPLLQPLHRLSHALPAAHPPKGQACPRHPRRPRPPGQRAGRPPRLRRLPPGGALLRWPPASPRLALPAAAAAAGAAAAGAAAAAARACDGGGACERVGLRSACAAGAAGTLPALPASLRPALPATSCPAARACHPSAHPHPLPCCSARLQLRRAGSLPAVCGGGCGAAGAGAGAAALRLCGGGLRPRLL